MKYDESLTSDSVEDRRGMKAGPLAAGGGALGVIVMLVGYFVLGLNPQQAQNLAKQAGGLAGGGAAQQRGKVDSNRPPDAINKFTKAIVASTEEVWMDQFRQMGKRYEKPKVVIFEGGVQTKGCGNAPSSVGPFYCPADRTVYFDPGFFDELETKLGGSKAEFSQAYVIAHEVGHHIQNLLGYSARVDSKRGTKMENDYSVRLELQADYLAGCWAYHASQKRRITLERGDLESALKSANSIGDDRLQKRSKGWTSPESYTHGTSEQRMKWFKAGFETGDVSKLDYFFETRTSGDL
ncbi:MAG: KPN_02809 family neutral zinc metallopeptidase [Fimbriiglobus sp.]